MSGRGPRLGRSHDEVAGRIFDRKIRVDVVRVQSGQLALDLFIASRRRAVRPEKVAKQQRVALVCCTGRAHVDMNASGSLGFAAISLLPFRAGPLVTRWTMVFLNITADWIAPG